MSILIIDNSSNINKAMMTPLLLKHFNTIDHPYDIIVLKSQYYTICIIIYMKGTGIEI